MHLNKGGGRATVLGGAIAVLSLGCGGTDGDLKGGGTGDAATTTDTTMAVTTTDTTTGPEEVEGTHAVTEAGVVLTVDGRAGEPIEACRTGDRLALWQPRSAIELFFDSLCETPADCEEKFGELYEQWHCV